MKAAGPKPLFLAGHPVLDFLNTRMRLDGELVDVLQSGEDVLRWLEGAGFGMPGSRPDAAPAQLADAARRLRENIRMLVEKRKAGQRGDPSVLNDFLAEAQSYPQLVWSKTRPPKIDRVRPKAGPKAILAQIAESAAQLVATADFSLVKRCEDGNCVLWFYDQTKSHHRRWCSMKLCGNRHKVAAYRKRNVTNSRP